MHWKDRLAAIRVSETALSESNIFVCQRVRVDVEEREGGNKRDEGESAHPDRDLMKIVAHRYPHRINDSILQNNCALVERLFAIW